MLPELPPITQEETLRIIRAAIARCSSPTESYHYKGCWRTHHGCAIAEIERLTLLLSAEEQG